MRAGRAGRRDHPRVCGEHKNGIPFRTQVQGSSPRVRGTRMRTAEWSCNIGIIPACAGNTMSLKNVSLRFWDHPRVCGEHHYNTICIAGHSGSSPRVRGTLTRLRWFGGISGIIPACAGNTRTLPTAQCCMRDHPRVCGEHLIDLSGGYANGGSSPRVRGTRQGKFRL